MTGSGSWNFGCAQTEDSVTLFGSLGKIEFSVFENAPVTLHAAGQSQQLMIAHPENIQLFHVENMRRHLSGEAQHPSTGLTAAHTSWVMDRILGRL